MSSITIIGTGGMAAAIAGRASAAGHTIQVLSRSTASAEAFADQLGINATIGAHGTVPTGDLVVLAVPYSVAAPVVDAYGDALAGKVIIDITNPYSPEPGVLVTPDGSSGAQELSRLLPAGTTVVKAFNTVVGQVLARGGSRDTFVASDDAAAKQRVSEFIATLGLRPLDVGGLAMARNLEATGSLLIGLAQNGLGNFDFALNVDAG
ncbi:putative dinucleotide-binding enzyme [Microbacterium sp. W4I4]|uniref:NADPH-dependent F420 reductase n=1 Tax=Microbacterium sp. W4I4 TaxID=3042295 RepID=UPI0027837F45|nr:NAD(P)-binding domain-containing protein [Microbacterium sp. W4I4]MDQ0614795.1 putative dinucleotide-binding enzyme [Microbacterium sp. W4I4]